MCGIFFGIIFCIASFMHLKTQLVPYEHLFENKSVSNGNFGHGEFYSSK